MKLRLLLPYLLIFIACLFFLIVFSWTTSPLYGGKFEGTDSAVFKLIGKYWADGYLPYVDLWDQKGPLIHAINAFGYKCIGSDLGIFLFQTSSLYLTVIFVYKSLKLVYAFIPSLLLTCFTLFSLSINFDGGNLVEEYLLPLISISYFCLLKNIINPKQIVYFFLFCLFVGLSIAFSLFTRLTNSLGVCASEFLFLSLLIYKRKYKSLLYGLLSTLLGFMIITIPVISYFYYKNALSEMWYGTFEYNLEYATSMSSYNGTLLYFTTNYLNCFVLTIIAILLLLKKKVYEGCIWLTTAILPLIWFINGAAFAHYGMIVFQYLCISFVLLNYYFTPQKYNNLFIKISIWVIVSIVAMGICIRISYMKNVFIYAYKQKTESHIERICQKYQINKNDIILYNYPGPEFIENQIKPGMRFFYLHDFLMSHGSSIEPKMIKSFAESKKKWVIAKYGVNNKRMKEFIEKHYHVIENGDNVVVYKLNK